MASALLASHNELSWGERNMHMKKTRLHDPKYKYFDNEMPKAMTARSAAVSENSTTSDRFRNYGGGDYVAFNFSNYSRRDRRELRQRLEMELEQVQSFNSRVPESKIVGPEMEKLAGEMMKKCGHILLKVMKQKKSGWFNFPVDAVRMGLHDYFQIVKSPMDLGTVRSKLNQGVYALPVEFAEDVRLTFNNALIYNPQGHEVHKLARQYLNLFESLFEPAYGKNQQQMASMGRGEQHVISSGVDGHVKYNKSMSDAAMRSEPPKRKVPTPPPMQAMSSSSHMQASRTHSKVQHQRYPPDKIIMEKERPKLKAKDLNHRQMSYEEKQNLGTALESLPHEKMAQVLEIVSKRNADPMQNGDNEIELDIEAIDAETLWELDRFVNSCKKAMTKVRRQEDARAVAPGDRFDTPSAVASKRSKKLDIADEDVDIGDEMPPAHYPTVEIEKNVGDASSSSSDSSSSDDSGSSSGSDSDDAQSPG